MEVVCSTFSIATTCHLCMCGTCMVLFLLLIGHSCVQQQVDTSYSNLYLHTKLTSVSMNAWESSLFAWLSCSEFLPGTKG